MEIMDIVFSGLFVLLAFFMAFWDKQVVSPKYQAATSNQ